MTAVKRDLLANLLGSGWTVLLGLASAPIYLKLMGGEAYGLVAFSILMQGLIVPLDLGLSLTLNRGLSRLGAEGGPGQAMRDLVRTMEVPYWAMAVGIAAVTAAISPLVAHYWMRPEHMSADEVTGAIVLMAAGLGAYWPVGLYSAGLRGTNRQVTLITVNAVFFTLRYAGAAAALWLIQPTIGCLFAWQAGVSVLHTSCLAWQLWRSLPEGERRARYSGSTLRNVAIFAGGNTGIMICGLILSKMDQLVVSKTQAMATFGYYSLAVVTASLLQRLSQPVSSAVFPRLTEMVHRDDREGISQLYHHSCQFLSVLMAPAVAVAAFFGYAVLRLWTQDPVAAHSAHLPMVLLMAGAAMTGLLVVPAALQMAHGWTRLLLGVNIASVVAGVPLLLAMTDRWATAGAAGTFLAVTAAQVLLVVPRMHRRLRMGGQSRWWLWSVAAPFGAALAVCWAVSAALPTGASKAADALAILAAAAASLTAAAAATPVTRQWLGEQWRRMVPA